MKIINVYTDSFNKITLISDKTSEFKSYKLNIENGKKEYL